MPEKIREHVCPNCGAPLGIPDTHERYFKCQFCGTVLEDNASKEEQQTGVFKIRISKEELDAVRAARIPVYTTPPVITSYTPTQTSGSANRLGCFLTVGILAFVGIILAVSLGPALLAGGVLSQIFGEGADLNPLVDNSGLGGVQLYSYGPIAMLPSDNDTTPDFAGIASGAESKNYLIYVDFENEPALRWMLDVTGEEISYVYNQFVADQVRLYLSYANTVRAFNRAEGVELWQATLPDEIQHNICPGCFQLIGDALVTLSADGTLAAWDAATGTSRWQVRLNETPRQIVNFGGNPGVLDTIDGSTRFYVFNITNGTRLNELYPTCPNEPFPDDPQEVGIYDEMLPVPNRDGVIFFGGFFDPGCAQLWIPGQDTPVWLTTFPADVSRNNSLGSMLLTDDSLYLASNGDAVAISLADGSMRTLYETEDYNFRPIAARDGVLVLAAERTRGTRIWEIWGIDAQLGNVKWTFVPEAAYPADTLSDPLDTDGTWIAGLTANGLTVAQLYDEAPRVIFQTIPLQSGTASAPLTYNMSGDSGGYWTSILGWRNNEFWVLGDTTLHVIDSSTAQTTHRWP